VFHKGEHKKCFAYNAQTACDKHGWVVATTLSSANNHDSSQIEPIYKEIKQNIGTPNNAVLDAGYKTPYVSKLLIDNNVQPYMPYKRPMTKHGYYPKYEYVYDEYYDCYMCPNNQTLRYTTNNKDGYREYSPIKRHVKLAPIYLNAL